MVTLIPKRLFSFCFVLGSLGCLIASSGIASGQEVVRGKVVRQQNAAGTFHLYVPKNIVPDVQVLVICHGTIEKENAITTSRRFIDRWLDLSERMGVVLVAPAFDKRNYASGKNVPGGAAWGYRALDGRTTRPGEFVHSILKQIKELAPKYDEKFYLYGHSAGAQFANHYLMVYPDRLKGVILSAPAIYAMPDFDTVWPNGLKERSRILDWGDGPHPFRISHKKKTVIEAVKTPIAVVIGSKDTKHVSDKPQQGGTTRVARARHYVNSIKRFAIENEVTSTIEMVRVARIGHDSAGLTDAAGRAFFAMFQKLQNANQSNDENEKSK